jgi:hypothetical protein
MDEAKLIKGIDGSLDSSYQDLLGRIAIVYTAGRSQAQQAVNVQLLETYWEIVILLSLSRVGR